MKKITLALLGAALVMTFVSCGSKPKDENADTPAAPETTEQVVETPEPEPMPEPEPVVTPEPEDDTAAKEADEAARANAKRLYEAALASKKNIDESEIAEYDQKHYDEGCKLLAELEAMLKDPSVTGAQLEEKATAVNGQFNSVLMIGFKKLARYWRDEAYESKKLADSVKAGVAEKARYQKAVKDFKEGDTLYAMQAAEKSCDRYIDADDEFTALYNELTEKRAAAQAAIEAAKNAIAKVESLAAEADLTDPVTEDTEGIEAEDTVLLEEDTYANPDDAVEELPETMNEAVVDNVKSAADGLNNLIKGDK